MSVLNIIKKRRTIRKYSKKNIPKREIDKIVDAGVWGPSVIGHQPWKFLVIRNRKKIDKVCSILKEESAKLGIEGRFMFTPSSNAIKTCNVLIFVYITEAFSEFARKFGNRYHKLSKIAEISAASAAIQNMILVGESLGIGSCWLDTPVFCEKKISALFEEDKKLLAALTFGYAQEKGNRCNRKNVKQMVDFIK